MRQFTQIGERGNLNRRKPRSEGKQGGTERWGNRTTTESGESRDYIEKLTKTKVGKQTENSSSRQSQTGGAGRDERGDKTINRKAGSSRTELEWAMKGVDQSVGLGSRL